MHGSEVARGEATRLSTIITMVPQPGLASDYNRYLAFRGNPLKFVDPSGHDPLDAAWEAEFEKNHSRRPNDQDRRDRLFSLMFRSRSGGKTWTGEDWKYYTDRRRDLWTGKQLWSSSQGRGVYSFAYHVGELAKHYNDHERSEFVMAMGLFWASMPYYSNPFAASAVMLNPGPRTNNETGDYPYFYEGELGWKSTVQGENQSHHYIALFYQGFFLGEIEALTINHLRDGTWLHRDDADLLLGDIAALQGHALLMGYISMDGLPAIILNSFSMIQPEK